MLPYIGELVGTFLLILLGDGVVANTTLNKSGMKGAGAVQITIAWGLAVMLPAFIFGSASGAHFNPALTLALAAGGMFPWAMVPGYIICQFLGAFLGACVVYFTFKNQYDATEEPAVIRGTFCTAPAIKDLPHNFFSEFIGTFVLVFAILGIGNATADAGLAKFFVLGIIVSIGMSLGGVTGYAINPARDLGPRFAHTILPIKHKGSSDWGYALVVTLCGPIAGGLVAMLCYNLIPW